MGQERGEGVTLFFPAIFATWCNSVSEWNEQLCTPRNKSVPLSILGANSLALAHIRLSSCKVLAQPHPLPVPTVPSLITSGISELVYVDFLL